MFTRSSSATPSSSSSTGAEEADGASAARLAALEALLSASLGYDEPAPAPPTEAEEPPRKKQKQRKDEDEDEEMKDSDKVEAGPTEVSFRLFSTQKAPQTVVIEEQEEVLEVKDPRIRDVADELKAVVKQRRKDIQSVALSGEVLLAQAATQPLSRHAHRVTTRLISHPPRAALPPLAYLNAILQPATKPTTRAKPNSLRSKSRALQPQSKRWPGPPVEKVKLKVIPIKSGAPLPASAKTKSGGRKRLSKERRVEKRRRDAKEMVRKAMMAVETPP